MLVEGSSSANFIKIVGPFEATTGHCDSCEKNVTLAQDRRARANRESDDTFDGVDYRLLPARALGYWLPGKRWVELDLDKVREDPPEPSPKAFEMLQIGEKRKNLIKDLIRNHQGKGPSMRDLNKEKGNGLVMLLHGILLELREMNCSNANDMPGPPGVGKTLTAGKNISSDVFRNLS